MDDLRVVAACLAALGIALGFLPFAALLGVTIGTAVVFYLVVSKENREAQSGTSGAMGLTLMIVGGWICVFVPAWITEILRLLFS